MRIKIFTAAAVSFAALLSVYLLMPKPDSRSGMVTSPTAYNDADQAVTASDAPPIDDLVEPLRQRLQQNPDDVDGWVLLGRSYHFLQRQQEAAAAFARARTLGWQGDAEISDSATPHAALDRSVVEGVQQAIGAADGALNEGRAASTVQP